MIDWLFRNRRTRALTVAQVPNASLAIFLVAAAVRFLVSPHGEVRTVVDAIAGVALLTWAGDEILRGVNPFRRILGTIVLATAVVGYLQ